MISLYDRKSRFYVLCSYCRSIGRLHLVQELQKLDPDNYTEEELFKIVQFFNERFKPVCDACKKEYPFVISFREDHLIEDGIEFLCVSCLRHALLFNELPKFEKCHCL